MTAFIRKYRAIVLALALVFCFVQCPCATAASVSGETEQPAFEMLEYHLQHGTDQRSARAVEAVNITTGILVAKGTVDQPIRNQNEAELATLLISVTESDDGTIEEQYVTITRATSAYKTGSAEAGELMAVARVYWSVQYDSLSGGNNIAFSQSQHFYYDSGSSGVTRIYGLNYVALGNNYDTNEANWYSPASGSVKSLSNPLSGQYSYEFLFPNNSCYAETVVYSNVVGTLTATVEFEW